MALSAQHLAVNWTKPEDSFSLDFLIQAQRQNWTEREYPVTRDMQSWSELDNEQRTTYKKVLAGLTTLDTMQGDEGMALIMLHTPLMQRRTVFSQFCYMEHVHAKSYSHIFNTICTDKEIEDNFAWANSNPLLRFKAATIDKSYRALLKSDPTDIELYMAMASSVLLESYLFYSGFFLPLWLAGQGKMVASSEIFAKIIQDESIHGNFTGAVANELYLTFSEETQKQLKQTLDQTIDVLYQNETAYSQELYDEISLTDEVLTYVRVNVNRAMMNLGFQEYYPDTEFNPLVQRGLEINNVTVNHDFFSTKGDYSGSADVQPITDEDLTFD